MNSNAPILPTADWGATIERHRLVAEQGSYQQRALRQVLSLSSFQDIAYDKGTTGEGSAVTSAASTSQCRKADVQSRSRGCSTASAGLSSEGGAGRHPDTRTPSPLRWCGAQGTTHEDRAAGPVPVQPLRICVRTWVREKVDWVKAALSKWLNRALTFWSNDCSNVWRFREGPALRTYFTSQRTHKLLGRTKRKSRAIPVSF